MVDLARAHTRLALPHIKCQCTKHLKRLTLNGPLVPFKAIHAFEKVNGIKLNYTLADRRSGDDVLPSTVITVEFNEKSCLPLMIPLKTSRKRHGNRELNKQQSVNMYPNDLQKSLTDRSKYFLNHPCFRQTTDWTEENPAISLNGKYYIQMAGCFWSWIRFAV